MTKQKRRIYCKFCDYFCYTPEDFVSHLEKHHDEMIPEDMTPWQFSYYLRTGKTHGNCIVCKEKTTWNEKTHKYNRFCGKQKCYDEYRKIFEKRMIGRYGKTTLLNDPEQQKKMLANRKISGEYLWRDHIHKSTYTGSYEKSFLEFLDKIMNFDPVDVMSPSPHTYYYIYEGKKHFYIPDFFIPTLDLEIEIKDGGDNINNHPKIQVVDKVKEKLKDDVMMKNQFNYIKITNQHNEKFLEFLSKAKENFFEKDGKPIYMIESSDDIIDMDNSIFIEGTINNDIDLDTLNKIVKKISSKVKSDEKKPVGNQNCMLCTWTLEAQLRGKDVLPRPVYSPRDIIFTLNPTGIIKSPKKEKFDSISDIKDILTKAGNGSRYYVHVNWKNSNSGHEFIIINIDNKIYVVDAQDGSVNDIDSSKGKRYFNTINTSNSYVVRLDTSKFNDDYLKYNDKKYILNWDKEKDIKYLEDHEESVDYDLFVSDIDSYFNE